MGNTIFEGVKVLDFTNNAAGPLTASLLADFGADVIKIERPVVGDDVRGFAPRIEGESVPFLWLNRGKKSVEIAMDDPDGQEIIKKMIETADVLVESFRPGVMKKFGLDYESVTQINPQIVYCSISAFGQDGPYSKKPGYDLIAQALSGLMDITGDPAGPPVKHGSIMGDYIGALNGFGYISAAMYHKKCTGEGQHVDVSLCDGLITFNNLIEPSRVMKNPTRTGNHSFSLCPYGMFEGKEKPDGERQFIIVCAPTNNLWTKVCKVAGRPEMAEKLDSAQKRISNLDQVIDVINGFAKQYDDIQDAVKILEENGIPSCKVQTTLDVIKDPHFLYRGSVMQLETTPTLKAKGIPAITARGPWVKLSKTPSNPKGAPALGQNNHDVLEAYGYTKEKIDELEKKWADKVNAK
ncbi:MAG: CoA transferase [Lachnospiraceae bacterium]|jgi:crotonobetainyl-CoA:carnitine CoA-transferase CaiB-like acyl-CoA transferase|nr:CoA transferase [Lachnospiraceae bacterium]